MPKWSRSSSLLAVGPCCPAGKHISMDKVEIVRALTCSHNCFISTVKFRQGEAVAPQAACTPGSPCSSLSTGPLGVAKSYRKAHLDDDEAKQVEAEIKVHQQLTSNPHVVPFWAAFETPDSITIITARCEGDLRGMLEQAGAAVSEEAVRSQIAAPMLQVLRHMHSKGFVHRDVKPENIFVSGGRAMLGDFGLAVAIPPTATPPAARAEASTANDSTSISSDQSSRLAQCGNISRTSSAGGAVAPKRASQLRSCTSSQDLSDTSSSKSGIAQEHTLTIRRSSSCGMLGFDCNVIPQLHTLHAGGTAAYTAPEVVAAAFNNTSVADAIGPQNDLWSLAVVLLECLKGRHPFGDPTMSPGAFLCCIISKTQAQINACINALPVSESCKDWLQQALTIDVTQRATAAQLIQHQWIAHAASGTSRSSKEDGQHQQQGTGQAGLLHMLPPPQQPLPQNLSCPEPFDASAPCTAVACDVRSLSNAALSSCLLGQGAHQPARGWETAAAGVASLDDAGTEMLRCNGGSAVSACCQQQLKAATQFSYMESIGSWED